MATLEGADPDFAARVNKFISSRKGITLTSGFRSVEHQQKLWNDALKKYGSAAAARRWVAPPGNSNHNHGTAADLGGINGISNEELAKYGLYRPMAHEPWHVEPIGSRSKGGPKAYTIPPHKEEKNIKVLEQLDAMLNMDNQVPVTMDDQQSAMQQQQSVVGQQNSVVGADGLQNLQDKPEPAAPNIDLANMPQGGGMTIAGGRSGGGGGGGNVNTNVNVKGFNAEQIANAAAIIRVGQQRGINARGIQVALMTAMQESGMRNVNYGDRDSLGLFQQRPSMGWGTPQQVRDPNYAAGKFYDTLVKVKGWESMPYTVAAQKVQRSAYPNAYAKHEGVARTLLQQIGGM